MNPRKGPPRRRSPRPARRALSGRDQASARRRAESGRDRVTAHCALSGRDRVSARRRAESGGAVSLWVVLMVPVSAFAAVVAMAGPQRMAAESSMDEAAEDLAMLAVAWREGHQIDDGPLPAFPPECSSEGLKTHFDDPIEQLEMGISSRQTEIDGLTSDDPQLPSLQQRQRDDEQALTQLTKDRTERQNKWLEGCEFLFEAMIRDLGNLGVDVNSLQGFYGGSLKAPDLPDTPGVPCKISERVEVRDAVHVALAADWLYAGWAAAQVWPDGTRMGAESIGRLRRSVTNSTTTEQCGEQLDVLDSQGRSVSLNDPDADSRLLSQHVPDRTVIEG